MLVVEQGSVRGDCEGTVKDLILRKNSDEEPSDELFVREFRILPVLRLFTRFEFFSARGN